MIRTGWWSWGSHCRTARVVLSGAWGGEDDVLKPFYFSLAHLVCGQCVWQWATNRSCLQIAKRMHWAHGVDAKACAAHGLGSPGKKQR